MQLLLETIAKNHDFGDFWWFSCYFLHDVTNDVTGASYKVCLYFLVPMDSGGSSTSTTQLMFRQSVSEIWGGGIRPPSRLWDGSKNPGPFRVKIEKVASTPPHPLTLTAYPTPRVRWYLQFFFMKMTAKDVKEITYMPLVTVFSVLERSEKTVRGLQRPPWLDEGWKNTYHANSKYELKVLFFD